MSSSSPAARPRVRAAFDYRELDDATRMHMLQELERDVGNHDVYVSPRLTARGRAEWVALLRGAAREHDAAWLAAQLRHRRLLQVAERQTRAGRAYARAVPRDAPATLAEGEFNRLYIRGLCARALSEGITTVVVYRARDSWEPRPGSEAMIGSSIDAAALLADLRRAKGREPALLPYVNSGLSVQLPRDAARLRPVDAVRDE